MFRLLVTYSGNVQGVGFRWKVLSISKTYEITGYVKNLPTGKVETLIEGERKAVLKMIEEIDEKLKDFWAKKGEELKYDYGFEFDKDDYADHVCKCGSKNCIGYIISSDDWNLYKKYLKKLKQSK